MQAWLLQMIRYARSSASTIVRVRDEVDVERVGRTDAGGEEQARQQAEQEAAETHPDEL